ncbi:MAG: type II/IV secretion system protein [Ignavibacteriae bacterium]|nr:type II/IV secretion system protein [Ignavibacteria bacterium]MBI3364996.1 type II/IV secretion system protein [Ignavibacteriota bacterium]
MIEELKNISGKVPLEQFDITSFAKEKIRDMFRQGKVPTADAMVDEIILRAVKEGATDIHFEPAEQELRVRMGFEGIMKRMVSLPKDISENLANVLKTKGSLNAFEKKKPQEGRFSITIGALQFDLRISTVPVLHGERVALRILQKNARVANVEELGFSKENLNRVRSLLRRPTGLFLVTGPSGSGKSTTVYASVNDIQSSEKNIITVENPVEYKLDFASQVPTGIDKSFTFVDALRAILRQNPNIIMLGEIRDAETGIVAAEAALTGNLVLSTMLSSDAVGTIFRLLNLGIPPYWLATTLIGVVYQQLVRKICESCKEEYQLTEAERHGLFVHMLSGQTKFYRGKGCEKCGGSGYLGRSAIHEVLSINDEMRDLMYQQASILKLKEAARAGGFESIFQDGMRKIASGITTVAEFSRALG